MDKIASFEMTTEGYTDYSKSKCFPSYDDYINPNPLPIKFLPKGILPLEEVKIIINKIKKYIIQDCDSPLKMNETCKKGENIPINYVDINDVVALLKVQENKCYICKQSIKVNYKAWCKNQITLDRINSKNPHLKGNVLISCWFCNCRDFNKQLKCKNECCNNKSNSLRTKKEISSIEIKELISKYNKEVDGNYSPDDDFIDYKNICEEKYHEDSGGNELSFPSHKASLDFFNIKQEITKNSLSRREYKNRGVEDDERCKCGRKNEEGSFGCVRWPGCSNNDFY